MRAAVKWLELRILVYTSTLNVSLLACARHIECSNKHT
jgi:hypothetical protein